jgi:hypothetical protein
MTRHTTTRTAVLFALIGMSFSIQASSGLKSGFEALEVHDYFRARKVFLKTARKHPVPSNYGLSVITGRNNNPFYELDSAYAYIRRSVIALDQTSAKKLEGYERYGVNRASIMVQVKLVQEQAWKRAEAEDEISAYTHFIEYFGESSWSEMAKDKRSALAFEQAKERNTVEAYADFLDRYPASRERFEASNRYESALFGTYAKEGTREAYQRFIAEHPTSLYVSEAEGALFDLEVDKGAVSSMRRFIQAYPENRNVEKAWRLLYEVETVGKGASAISAFVEDYPDYPFADEVSLDLEAVQRVLYPYVERDQWGFIDKDGVVRIPARFEWVEPFEGMLALVGLDEKVGTIDKTGRQVIPCSYDEILLYPDGTAMVSKDGKVGLMDLTGEVLVKMEYDDLGEPVDGILFAELSGKFGYVNERGDLLIPFVYDFARAFQDGRAVVGKNDSLGVIRGDGNVIIPFLYEYISEFEHGVARVRANGRTGLISEVGEIMVEPVYEYIGPFRSGLALAVLEGRVTYMDTSGTVAIEGPFEASVGVENWGDFNQAYARVRKAKKMGLINQLGESVLAPRYDGIGMISNGIVPVERNGEWYYVVLGSGKAISSNKYEEAAPFMNGIAYGRRLDGEVVVIDTTGQETDMSGLEEIVWTTEDSIYAARTDSSVALFRYPREEMLSAQFDQLRLVDPAMVEVRRNGRFAYYRLDQQRFIWKQEGF